MTEIKLMNYGRGAGKTYTLKNWQLEDPKHRFIVCLSNLVDNYPEVTGSRIVKQLDLAKSEDFFAGYLNLEVAFDGFDISSQCARDALANTLRFHPKTVILATSHDTMETEAAKKMTFGADQWRRAHGFPDIEGPVAEGITKVAGDIGREFIKQYNEGPKEDSMDAPQLEPIQSMKGPDLRLGDWVVGKGCVVSLVEDDYAGTVIQTSEEGNGKYASTSTVELRYNQTIDIDITKRK